MVSAKKESTAALALMAVAQRRPSKETQRAMGMLVATFSSMATAGMVICANINMLPVIQRRRLAGMAGTASIGMGGKMGSAIVGHVGVKVHTTMETYAAISSNMALASAVKRASLSMQREILIQPCAVSV
mmetsp:Transcript_100968/g.159176  ORF Transcript_100968/g.159176 Transcript_100968/m.159176 type:complete len:130 (-) Transcript_100968:827-1216(-)